jgi:hypothetical protein
MLEKNAHECDFQFLEWEIICKIFENFFQRQQEFNYNYIDITKKSSVKGL